MTERAEAPRWADRELARVRMAWLKRIQIENGCRTYLHDKPCRFQKCACLLEMESYIVDEYACGRGDGEDARDEPEQAVPEAK